MAIAQNITIVDYLLPTRTTNSSLLKNAALVVGSSILMALSARASLHLPFTPIPLTLQTLVVMLVGAALGSRRAFLAMLLYLAEGATGLPVFASGLGGLLYLLTAPSAGYLWSFPVAAFVVGLFSQRGLDRSIFTSVLGMLVGTLIIYAFGVSWLAIYLHSLPKAFIGGMLPFIPGDLIKIIIAAALLPTAWAIAGSARSNQPEK